MNAWIDPNFKKAVKKSGKKRIVICGLWTSICITFPTIDMLAKGYDVIFVQDTCGDLTQTAHDAGVERMIQAGATPVTALALLFEYQQDWARTSTADRSDYVFANLSEYKNQYRLIKYFQNDPIHYINPTQFPKGITNNTIPLNNCPYPIQPYVAPPVPPCNPVKPCKKHHHHHHHHHHRYY